MDVAEVARITSADSASSSSDRLAACTPHSNVAVAAASRIKDEEHLRNSVITIVVCYRVEAIKMKPYFLSFGNKN